MRTCAICNLKLHKYNWERIIITHVNSKNAHKEYRGNRWNISKRKENGDFAIDEERAFGGIRLRMAYNEEIQDYDKSPRPTFANSPCETKDKERMIWHFPKQDEIPRKGILLFPYCAPSFSKLYALTRHLYGSSCPNIKRSMGIMK